MALTAEEWAEAKRQPEVEILFAVFREWRTSILEQFANGNFVKDSTDATAVAHAQAVAELGVLNKILDLDAEQINGALE